MTATRTCFFALAAATQLAAASLADAQTPARTASADHSAAQLRRALDGLTTTARVLIVGMHPDDDLPQLSTWLSRGRGIETAYLFITRGENGEDFNGTESGPSLGVVRVAETLNARRIDGAHQYFTRASDFGGVRSPNEVFITPIDDTTRIGTWERDSVIADVVSVVRAYRPQLIINVSGDTTGPAGALHLALSGLMDSVFVATNDSMRFRPSAFGAPWPVAKMYRVGTGVTLNTGELDRLEGRTYTAIGRDVRAQQRSQGPPIFAAPLSDTVDLALVRSQSMSAGPDSSLFAGIDTSLTRFAAASPEFATIVARITTLSDSMRRVIGDADMNVAVRPLAELLKNAADFRRRTPSCGHSAALAAVSVSARRDQRVCTAADLDRDAAADLLRERATTALLSAAGVEITATSDRELVASLDSANVVVTIANRGGVPVTLSSISVHGSHAEIPLEYTVIAPGATLELPRSVSRLQPMDAWWTGNRVEQRYPEMLWPRDGVRRAGVPASSLASAQAVPEELRRATDVSVLLQIAGTEVVTSIGPVLYRHIDPFVGVQYRQLSGAPEVTVRFARILEWLPANKPFTRIIHVKLQSFSDHPILLGIGKAAEPGIVVNAIPKEVRLDPHEQRELLVPIRGQINGQKREDFLVWGLTAQATTYQMGYQSIERPYLEPSRNPRSAGAYLRSVDMTVPPTLAVYYVPEGVDDMRSVLTQVGISVRDMQPEVLLTADLSHISAIVLAPRSVERFPEIGAQANRLMEYVRNGGTLVIQRGGDTTLASKLLPFPVSFAKPAESVLHPDAVVRVISPSARVLNWPNKLTKKDWEYWPLSRAESIPTTADPRYERVIETHDPGQPENRNAILIGHVGKGQVIYTSLTLDQQIAGSDPGALRLLVNLISAGVPR